MVFYASGPHRQLDATFRHPDVVKAADGPPSRGRGLARLCAAMISTVTGELPRSLGEAMGAYEDGLALNDEVIACEGAMMHGGPPLGGF